jgi:hypothetical protein
VSVGERREAKGEIREEREIWTKGERGMRGEEKGVRVL